MLSKGIEGTKIGRTRYSEQRRKRSEREATKWIFIRKRNGPTDGVCFFFVCPSLSRCDWRGEMGRCDVAKLGYTLNRLF